MRYQSYLNTAQKIIELYKGEEPLASYLKKFFAANKKYGSKDRKYISTLCYAYFRLGKACAKGTVAENIITALFLSEIIYNEIILFFKPEWEEWLGKNHEEKIYPAENRCIVFPVPSRFGKHTVCATV